MAARLRLIGWNVQPVFMVDDGNDLSPGTAVNPQLIPVASWEAFKDGQDRVAIEQLTAEFDRQQAAEATPPPARRQRSRPKR